MAAARHIAAVHASGSGDGGQLSRQELVKYIKHQEHLLSNIESLSGININKVTTTHKPEHHFKHSKQSPDPTEHYDNIFAKAKDEDDDPDAFADQSDNSGDASARAWNNVRTLSPPLCARPAPRSMPMPHRATSTRPSPLTRAPAHAGAQDLPSDGTHSRRAALLEHFKTHQNLNPERSDSWQGEEGLLSQLQVRPLN